MRTIWKETMRTLLLCLALWPVAVIMCIGGTVTGCCSSADRDADRVLASVTLAPWEKAPDPRLHTLAVGMCSRTWADVGIVKMSLDGVAMVSVQDSAIWRPFPLVGGIPDRVEVAVCRDLSGGWVVYLSPEAKFVRSRQSAAEMEASTFMPRVRATLVVPLDNGGTP